MFVQCGVKGINVPYNPDYADENYSYEYGGYVDTKRRGSGDRGRRSGRRPLMGYGGRYVSALCVICTLVNLNVGFGPMLGQRYIVITYFQASL